MAFIHYRRMQQGDTHIHLSTCIHIYIYYGRRSELNGQNLLRRNTYSSYQMVQMTHNLYLKGKLEYQKSQKSIFLRILIFANLQTLILSRLRSPIFFRTTTFEFKIYIYNNRMYILLSCINRYGQNTIIQSQRI